MAKKNYESKVAMQTAEFIEKRDGKPPVVYQEVHDEPQTEHKKETGSDQNGSNTDRNVKTEEYHRYTFYVTFEEKAALDQISDDEKVGLSDIVRQVLDAGLEAISPGIFEKTKDKANELRYRETSRRKKSGNNRTLYDKLKKSFE